MSRFFKSAAFPILIVVVLAFFAQKLIGSSSNEPSYTFGNSAQQLDNGQVKSLSLDQKQNSASVTLNNGTKYTVGYPDSYANTLINEATGRRGGQRSTSRASPPTAGCRC